MPRAFLVKKKQAACGGWRWRDPEQLEWTEEPSEGKAKVSFDKFSSGFFKIQWNS